MISREIYDALKKDYAYSSSWTIWSSPSNNNWKSKDSVDNMEPFSDENKLIEELNGDYIFVGLNPAEHDENKTVDDEPVAWMNFHSGDKRRSQDYKLRNALRNTKFSGSFIMDIYKEIETNANKVIKNATDSKTQESIEKILSVREKLGRNAAIIAIGNKAYDILKKKLPADIDLKKITHYSARLGPCAYCDKVHQELNINAVITV